MTRRILLPALVACGLLLAVSASKAEASFNLRRLCACLCAGL